MKTILTVLICSIAAVLLLMLPARAPAQQTITTDALLDTLQHSAFLFFWNEANPSNGLIKDRSSANSACSIASVGFGLSAICIGADHHWVTREAARDRVLVTLRTFLNGPQSLDPVNATGSFGLFYHFLDMSSGLRDGDTELSTIDTALLLAGIIDAREYFSGTDSVETEIRQAADAIYDRMNWDLMRNFNPGILMGWKPLTGFAGYGQWVGYNEATIMYILALGSATFPVDEQAWATWTQGYTVDAQYGQSYVIFPPLFGHQYSHCWIDFRAINDAKMRSLGLNYFENSRRATLAQRAYSVANPGHHRGYSDSLWGITASDAPGGYKARGAPPPQNDDGTIAPTAPLGSIAFAPEAVLPVARNMWENYRTALWTKYGFRDAFNLDVNWFDTDVIGIDQGPIILMIENYRTGAVWRRFMQNQNVQRGLARAGFTPITDVAGGETAAPAEFALEQNYPNPFNPSTVLTFHLERRLHVRLTVFDVLGTERARLVDGVLDAGRHQAVWNAAGCPAGIYFCRLTAGGRVASRAMALVK